MPSRLRSATATDRLKETNPGANALKLQALAEVSLR